MGEACPVDLIFAAFIPIIGAFAAGASPPSSVALVFQGFTEALIVFAAIVVGARRHHRGQMGPRPHGAPTAAGKN